MADSNLSVEITLDEVEYAHGTPSIFPIRTLTLKAPDWAVKIGRSTSSGTGPRQEDTNAWYSSRVISRDHAELLADPKTREILIRDCASMHGTHVDGRRLRRGVTQRVTGGEVLVFGAEVARGDETFLPIEVVMSFTWSDGESRPEGSRDMTHAQNSFTADYLDEEPEDYESDSSMVSRVEAAAGMKRDNIFTVPESDVSDDQFSVISDESLLSDEDSPTSSPMDHLGPEEVVPTSLQSEHKRSEARDHIVLVADEDSYYEDSSVFDDDDEEPRRFGPVHEAEQAFQHWQSSPLDVPGPGRDLSQSSLLSPSPPKARAMRAPSPSDAAMAKSAAEARSPPFGQTLPRIPPPQVMHDDSYYPSQVHLTQTHAERNASAWAGHNSGLYDTFPPSMVPETYFPADQAMRNQPADTIYTFHDDTRNTQDWYSGVPHQFSFAPLEPIDFPEASTGQKRKADLISDDDMVAEQPDRQSEVQAASDGSLLPTIDPAALQPIVVTETIERIESSPAEPARKKIKKHKQDSGVRDPARRSTFAKYAATAIAGAAVGAAGTIWGLVSLPKDYFV